MIQASEAFKKAARSGAFQRAMLRFSDRTLTNEDIRIESGGIQFTERFNYQTDLVVGQAVSSSIKVYIGNKHRLFSDYAFGEFTAQIGAAVSQSTYTRTGNVTAVWNGKTFTGYNSPPYLKENGAACSVQPGFAVKSIVVDGNRIWCIGDNRNVYAFDAGSTHRAVSNPAALVPNEFMWRKVESLADERRGIALSGQTETEWLASGITRTLEYVKLGTFVAQRPSVLLSDVVELDADDRMSLFDDVWMRDVALNYPTTLGAMLTAICSHVGVPLVSASFLNSWMSVAARPDKFDEATARDCVKWIAEAACSFARFNRDGALELVWFTPSSEVFDESNYSDFTPYSYSVKPITQLYVRNADSTAETRIGNGDNVYLIQDNPFLRQDDGIEREATVALMAAEPRAATPNDAIYNRLAGFQSFNPSTADLFTDWTMQAGDIVTVKSGDESYSLPVYTMDMRWRGSPKIVATSTGNETREPPTDTERATFETNRAVSGLGGRAKGLEDRMSWAEININENESFIQLTAGRVDEAEGRISQAEIDIDGAKADIKLWAQRTEDNENKISQAQIDIDGANAKITAEASRTDTLEGTVSEALISINGLKADILLKASRSEVDALGERLNQAEIDIDGANANIKLKADSTTVNALGNRVSSAEIDIDGLKSEITLKADKITLEGYVTASQLSAFRAEFDNLTSGYTSADALSAKTVYATSQLSIGTSGGGALYYRGTQYLRQGVTLGSAGGYIAEGHFLGDSATTLNLNHYHKIVAEEQTDGTIKIALTTPIPTSNTTDSTTNFKIADTKAYKDGVSAARNGVDFNEYTYSALSGPTQASRTVTAHITNGKSKDLPLFLTQGGWSNNALTVSLHANSQSGTTLASTSVDASSIYNSGSAAGRNSVTLNDFTANAGTGTTSSRTVYANASNGAQKSLPLYLTVSGLTVYLHWNSSDGTVLARASASDPHSSIGTVYKISSSAYSDYTLYWREGTSSGYKYNSVGTGFYKIYSVGEAYQ